MGTPEPEPVDEDGFHKKIVLGQAFLMASAILLLVMLAFVVIKAVRKRQRPKYSLLWLLAMTVAAGGCVLSGLHWRESAKEFEAAKIEYAAAKARFEAAGNDEKPAHSVTLTMPFYMGKFAVTQEQYQQVTGQNPSEFKGVGKPVESVSWLDSQEFCKKCSEQTNRTVRLSTEAEWEYSCRAGTTTTYHSGDAETDLARVAWYAANSMRKTHPVGLKKANAFGLYDMHGNVWQWCEDWYGEDYYVKFEAENPQGPAQGTFRVLRGGSWYGLPMRCRSAFRLWLNTDYRNYFVGFRVVVEPVFGTP
jgi:formylglycine-generating enzyme required for sulfatase activity